MDSLLDNAPCGYLRFSDDGIVETVNATLTEMLSRTPESMVGKHIENLFPPGGRIFYQTHFFPLLRLHGKAEEIYMALQSSDGTEVPVLINAARRERESVIGNECVVVRIRQRIRFEEELLRAKKAAELASDAKAKFLSMMSHELRTPLQAIANYTQLLALGLEDALSPDQRKHLSRIDHACHSLRALIDDILNFARLENGHVSIEPQAVSIGEAMERAEALLLFRVEEAGICYDRTRCAENHVVSADPDRLQQIILNLLTNALKFTDSHGYIHVECKADGRQLLLHVCDNGCGVPENKLDAIFEPFIQLRRSSVRTSQQGAGLGLAISRQLARAMAGDLTVRSEMGVGSVFTLALPIAPAVKAHEPNPVAHTTLSQDANHPQTARRASPALNTAGPGTDTIEPK